MTTPLAARDKSFTDEMQALLAGEKQAADATLQHFIERFRQAQKELEASVEKSRGLDTQLAEARTLQAKLTGFLEGLAVDLRHLWDKQDAASAPAEGAAAQG